MRKVVESVAAMPVAIDAAASPRMAPVTSCGPAIAPRKLLSGYPSAAAAATRSSSATKRSAKWWAASSSNCARR